MPKLKRVMMPLALILLVAGGLAACEDDPDTVGEAVEELGDEVGDAAEDAADDIEDAADDAANP